MSTVPPTPGTPDYWRTREGRAEAREYIAGLRPGDAALSKGSALALIEALYAAESDLDDFRSALADAKDVIAFDQECKAEVAAMLREATRTLERFA